MFKKMKKKITILLLCILAITIAALLYINPPKKGTELILVNNSKDTVKTYLTLGADTDYVTNVKGVFGIQDSGLQGSLILLPGDTLRYTSPEGKGIAGNFSFGIQPINCPVNKYPEGVNIFEFALNNNFKTVQNAQETIDISCVAGVNSSITCFLSDKNWNAGDTAGFQFFENSYLYDNVGRIGVYPYGCDDCTQSVSPPFCEGHPEYSKPQAKPICNVQRDASKNGGSVTVVFNNFIKGIPAE